MIAEIEDRLGHSLFDYQKDCIDELNTQRVVDNRQRLCLYYRTGAGKTLTSLMCLHYLGHHDAIVIAPPTTHDMWIAAGKLLDIQVQPMSHAKFRQKTTLLPRTLPVVADEFHMFGGHGGLGWKKLDRLAGGLKAPMILASATPNYNDAERVYCIQHVLDPMSCRGGYIEFLYRHCETEANAFAMEPIVTGFRNYPNAAAYLADLPGVYYLPDTVQYTITDIDIPRKTSREYEEFWYDHRRHRIVASQIEDRHTRVIHGLCAEDGHLRHEIYDALTDLVGNAAGPVLIFANHSTVVEHLDTCLDEYGVKSAIVTGKTPAKKKEERISAFRDGVLDVLVGTSTLATGTDGLDKVCDMLIILDDTDDDALRRQLIGRIMPRGADSDASMKQVVRFVLPPP